MLVLLSVSFVYGEFSTDRTDYYTNGTAGFYFADGLTAEDLDLYGNSRSNSDTALTGGWSTATGNTADYSSTQSNLGSVSIHSNRGGNLWIRW